MASACALAMFSGKNIYNFGVQKRPQAFLNPIFTGRGRDGKWQLPRWFPAETAARRVDGCAFSREKGIEINFPNKGIPRKGQILPAPGEICPQGVKAFCSSQTVKIDFHGKHRFPLEKKPVVRYTEYNESFKKE